MCALSIQYVTNASSQSGVGHQAEEIVKRLIANSDLQLTKWHIDGEAGKLLQDGHEVARVSSWPGVLGSKSINWLRLGRRISSSPDKGRKEGVFHFTNQTLSFLAKRLHPSVVTVHDIIELLEPQDTKAYWLNKYLYCGTPVAAHIICVSEFTKKQVQEHYGISDDKITVIHNGVGPEFHPINNFEQTIAYQELRHTLKLAEGVKVVLYVGSDHPRKNVITAVQAFAKIKDQNIVFLKVGAAGLPAGRVALLDEIEKLGIRESVRFIEHVPTDGLNALYNLADVFMFPSKNEGFGLPPLQAMAAGTPVITSNATSLPEVVGEAALMHDPDDVDAFAASLMRVLSDSVLADQLREKGLRQAQRFSWDSAAVQVAQVYKKVSRA